MSDVTDGDRFEFEKEKWRADIEMRRREVEVKERDQAESKWRSPLVVAIMAAAAAAGGNAIVAVVNGTQQVALENSKAESTRILEMIKTGDTERAAGNMEFLLKSGLVTDATRVERLARYLKEREPGTGPSLPVAASPFSFEPTESLTKPVQDRLQRSLDAYVAYLAKVGFSPASGSVKIKIDKQFAANTTYSQESKLLTIGEKMLGDVSVALQTYTYHVLEGVQPDIRAGSLELGTIEVALADYFAASFLNEPKIGEIAAKALQPNSTYIRTLENNRKFADLQSLKTRDDIYGAADVWGGLLWAVRQKIGKDNADAAIANAWRVVKWPSAKAEHPSAFLGAILSSLKATGAVARATDVEVLARARGFPLPQ